MRLSAQEAMPALLVTEGWCHVSSLRLSNHLFASAFCCLGRRAGKTEDFSGRVEQNPGLQPALGRHQELEQQGLDVQLVLLRGMPMTVQALSAGSLHIGSGGAEPYIDASERGLDFILTGGVINGTAQSIIAAKHIKTYEDLRGATFGTASLTGGTITVLREAL